MSPLTTLLLAAAALAFGWWIADRRWRKKTQRLATAAGRPEAAGDDLLRLLEQQHQLAHDHSKEHYLRRLFESLLNEIRQGVIIVDPDLKIRFANRTAAQLFHRPEIRRGRSLMEETQDHQLAETVREALQGSRRVVRQIRLLPTRPSASSRDCLIETAPLPSESERGAWLMVQDISDQVMTDQIRKDFVANASHELRTPLTLIQGYIETLRDGGLDDPALVAHSLKVMQNHSTRIIRIVEDMLTISKLENLGTQLNWETFSMVECVQDVIDRLRPLLQDSTVKFAIQFPDDGCRLVADRFYWDQILTNLIENAIKENTGRQLTVSVQGERLKDQCVIRVIDNGVGIAAHDVPFVFKRFYRGHKHHAQTVKGTGLGLSIVRRAIEAHGGSIDLESIPGRATTFTIRLPHREAPPPAAA
ncbi:MAG: PAS domain-containing protein [Verrucomicrobiales bacterium]|nr:PAS domain-containing protein [Verrucomicrobiales bacterium]